MQYLIELLQNGKMPWLTVPRFAVVVLPLALAGLCETAGLSILAVLMTLVSAVGLGRLVWFKLLPHEVARLSMAREATANMRPDDAVKMLQAPLRLSGTYYMLLRADLMSKAYVQDGLFTEAHAILNTIDERALLQNELVRLQTAWARFFVQIGNLNEARHRLEGFAASDYPRDADFLLIKSWIEQQQGNLLDAREILESALDQKPEDGFKVLLLNNLAAIERLQGRPSAQLRHLEAALVYFRKSPRADLVSVLHHNLSIALVRAGRVEEARKVLREAWASGDETNLRHVLAVLNDNLDAAREAGDDDWKRVVHEEFERQLMRCGTGSLREQLALDVTRLRMTRNDGVPLELDRYYLFIGALLDRLQQPILEIPESDRVAALCEIQHDVKRAFETQQLKPLDAFKLNHLLRQASRQLLDKRGVVETYLSELSPKLTGPLALWYRYCNAVDKAEILLAENDEELFQGLRQLFQHLRERAESLTEQQGPSREAIKAWVVLCDEYLAYDNQLPVVSQLVWRRDCLPVAKNALSQVMRLLDACKNQQNHVDLLIGVSFFAMQLQNDTDAAKRYMSVVKQQAPSMDHYATWLRDHYRWVVEQLAA